MELTPKERLAWLLYAAGSLLVVLSTNAINGAWPALAALGGSLITAAAGLGIQGLRPTQGGRT